MRTVIYHLPESFGEFCMLPQNDLTKPENTCALFLCALHLYLKNKNEGIEAMNFLRGPRPMTPYDIQFLRDRLRDKNYLPLAYFSGAVPENNYTPSVPYVLDVTVPNSANSLQPGYFKIFLSTAGADSPRPVTLRMKGDRWYLWEYSSILSGIRIPAAQDPWA